MTAPKSNLHRGRRLVVRLVVFLVVLPALAFGALELAARAFWVDQYELPDGRTTVTVLGQAKATRMHPPRLAMTMRADGIYQDGGAVRFATDSRCALMGDNAHAATDREHPVWLALGGSTTECALVPTGQRWPDLLDPPAINFGVSGNTCMHSLRNLVHLLPLGPKRVYVLHSYNDLLAFTRQGERLDLAGYEGGSLDLYARERPHGWLAGSRLGHLVTYLGREWAGRHYLAHYQAFVAAQSSQPWLDDAGFAQLLAILPGALLQQRSQVFAAMAQQCAAAGAELVLLTQPHSYAAAGLAGPDLRTSLVWQAHKLRFAQCAQLLQAVNDHTRQVGRQLGLTVIDVAGAFAERDSAPLFYDQVHYTPAGCRVLADLLR
jgi:hypothetical protein